MSLVCAGAGVAFGVAALVLTFVKRTKRKTALLREAFQKRVQALAQEEEELLNDQLAGRKVKRSGEIFVNPKDVWAPTDLERGLRRLNEVQMSEVPMEDVQTEDVQTTPTEHSQEGEVDLEMEWMRIHAASRLDMTMQEVMAESLQESLQEPIPLKSEPTEATENLSSPTEQKPPTCTFPGCGKTFAKVFELNHHARYHLKSKPCPIPSCLESFATTKDLNRHINSVHQTTKKYYCTVHGCKYSKVSSTGASFSRKDNWRRHMRDRHGKGEEEISRDGDEMDLED